MPYNRGRRGDRYGCGDAVEANNGDTVTYEYATTALGRRRQRQRHGRDHREGLLQEFDVDIADLDKVGAGGISDLWAWLAPAGETGDDDDREGVLSYLMMPVTDPKSDDGDIIKLRRVRHLPAVPLPHLRGQRQLDHGHRHRQHHHG